MVTLKVKSRLDNMKQFYVYVIGLKIEFSKTKKAREANPNFNPEKKCYYVGYTSKTPEQRYQQHITGFVNKKGHKLSSKVVEKFGYKRNGLRPRQYEKYNPIQTQEEAMKMEEVLANKLRKRGHCVWQR